MLGTGQKVCHSEMGKGADKKVAKTDMAGNCAAKNAIHFPHNFFMSFFATQFPLPCILWTQIILP